MLTRTTHFRPLVVLVALTLTVAALAVPALASAAPADDLAALLGASSPVECSEVTEPHTQSGANPTFNCSCSNRILICSVNLKVYYASP